MHTKVIRFIYKQFIKRILFLFPPDYVHDFITILGRNSIKVPLIKPLLSLLFKFKHPSLNQQIAGITFENPVGLSAGFDKDGLLVEVMPSIGFGFMQVGTVTKDAYSGNPRPWAYRLKKSKAILVNYGLKNQGAKRIIQRLKNSKFQIPVSISVGKTNSKDTASQNDGVQSYVDCIKEFEASKLPISFYTINISCPNTFGGEPFTTAQSLGKLLKKVVDLKLDKPIFIKMPINLKWEDFKELLKVIISYKLTGVIIGNLQKDHTEKSIIDRIPKGLKGGISGKPTFEASNFLIQKTYQEFGKELVIVGVGGIFSAEDAYEKIKLGASLVQIVTAMIYEGPSLIRDINKGLVDLLKLDGYTNLAQAVGQKNIY